MLLLLLSDDHMEWSGEEEKIKKHEMQLHELYLNANHSSLIDLKWGRDK